MEDSNEGDGEGLATGTQLGGGRFEIIRELGQGGFGITYLAQQFTPERLVAIKEFFPGGSARRLDRAVTATGGVSRDEFDRLRRIYEREGNALAKFDHPNIVSIFDVFEENDTAYLILSYLDGISLEEIPRCENEEAVKVWLMPALDALQVIHDQQLLHRDISPDNIMMVDGKPVLLDFGAVRLGVDANEDEQKHVKSRKKSSFAMVKDGYAPTEQYVSGSRQSEATDIYALAATVYYTITGEDPVSAQARQNEIHNDEEDPLEPLSEGVYEGYSNDFLQAIDVALSVRKKDRPQNVSEWRDLIEQGGKVERDLAPTESEEVLPDDELVETVDETTASENGTSNNEDLESRENSYSSQTERTEALPNSKRNFGLIAVLLLAVLMGCSTYWWINIRAATSYHEAYKVAYGMPVGIGSLSKSDMSARNRTWRIRSKGGLVRSFALVNGYDRPMSSDDYIGVEWAFTYGEDDKVSRIEFLDRHGTILLTHNYEFDKSGTSTTINFKDRFGDTVFLPKGSSMPSFAAASLKGEKTKISRFKQILDENGLISKALYKTQTGAKASDNGIFGRSYHYNELGLPRDIYSLDSNLRGLQTPGSAVAEDRKYDDKGRLLERSFSDGRYNRQGNSVLDAAWKVTKVTYKYDRLGNNVSTANWGLSGEPILDVHGHHLVKMAYDERGNLVKSQDMGTTGKPITNKSGHAQYSQTFDDQGNATVIEYYNSLGNPTLRNGGYHKETRKYDSSSNPIEANFYGIEGDPVLVEAGFAVWTQSYDVRGNVTKLAYFGTDGQPVRVKSGYTTVEKAYDERDRMIMRRYTGFEPDKIPIFDTATVGYNGLRGDEKIQSFKFNGKHEFSKFGTNFSSTCSPDVLLNPSKLPEEVFRLFPKSERIAVVVRHAKNLDVSTNGQIQNLPFLSYLILNSESMNTTERQDWFNRLAVMSDQQIASLKDILVREQNKLRKIDCEHYQ